MEENRIDAPADDATAQASTAQKTESPKSEAPKTGEVSASTIGRMMGLATMSDLRLLDSKIDLMTTKVAGLTVKMDKIMTTLSTVATASDLERIDVQIGSVRTTLRETVQEIKDAVRELTESKV